MQPEITCRQLTPDDLDAWLALRLQAVTDEPQAFARTPEEIHATPPAEFARRLAKDYTVGAFDGEMLVGMAGYFIHEERKYSHRGYIHGVYLLPEYRGSGAAECMMQELIDHARAHVEHLELSSAWDPRAVRFYTKLGFKEYGRFPKIMKLAEGAYVDDIYMWMDLTG